MRDVTEYALSKGYTGQTPVMVRDGYVVSPFRRFWPDFCHHLRVEKLKKELRPGVEVMGHSDFARGMIGEVVTIRGMYVDVRWGDDRSVTVEWLPDLEPTEEQEL